MSVFYNALYQVPNLLLLLYKLCTMAIIFVLSLIHTHMYVYAINPAVKIEAFHNFPTLFVHIIPEI